MSRFSLNHANYALLERFTGPYVVAVEPSLLPDPPDFPNKGSRGWSGIGGSRAGRLRPAVE